MLGLLLIYFVGKKFYDLADNYDMHLWKNAIIGVVIYYAGTFIGGMILGIIDGFFGTTITQNIITTSVIAIPFGVVACYFYYNYLEKKFKQKASKVESIDDIGNSDN